MNKTAIGTLKDRIELEQNRHSSLIKILERHNRELAKLMQEQDEVEAAIKDLKSALSIINGGDMKAPPATATELPVAPKHLVDVAINAATKYGFNLWCDLTRKDAETVMAHIVGHVLAAQQSKD